MTRDQLQWLSDPVNELRPLPVGTLLVVRSPSSVVNLAEIFPREPDDPHVKYRRLPDCRVFDMETSMNRRVQIAVLGEGPETSASAATAVAVGALTA